MNRRIFSLIVAIAGCGAWFSGTLTAQNKPIYQDDTQPIEMRVEDALRRMTVEEKIGLLHANGGYTSGGVPRLGIPGNFPTDGPVGLRPEMYWSNWAHAGMSTDSCTAFPALVCLAATWNPEMGIEYGKAYSEEAIYREKNIILGPGVNIFRSPMNGRNFEYMGEDPYLASQMAVSYIQGVQSNHVAACVKHFAVNNQEANRYAINTLVDERTLHEIYLPAFKAAVQQGHVWSIMGAYNKYDGQHCCHNQYLLNDLLKNQWNFDGVVISDFGGTHDTREAIFNGLDMEFGTRLGSIEAFDNYYLAKPYLSMIKEGKVSETELNDKVRRILRMMFRTSMSGKMPWGSQASEAHIATSRKVAEEGIVLLKNDGGILPIDLASKKRILVVGENAVMKMAGDGGSSEVKAKYEVTPLQGIKARFGSAADCSYQPGYSSKQGANADSLRSEAVKAARNADVVIYVGGLNKQPGNDCEGADRLSYNLPYGQDQLIEALASANANVVAVMVAGNAYAMPWVKKVPAIVQAWYGGMECGNAIAAVVAGDVNPSGKLPFTFPVSLDQNGAHVMNAFPGHAESVTYSEGIFVGYRWTEYKGVKPLFAFGHGLSYTTFDYGKIKLSSKAIDKSERITVTLPIANTGKREGAEVVQLYVRDVKSSLPRPVKELKSFAKVNLKPGESTEVAFELGVDELSFYDPDRHKWVAEPGKFEILIGSASDAIRSRASFELK